jgi:hypothetical protein
VIECIYDCDIKLLNCDGVVGRVVRHKLLCS